MSETEIKIEDFSKHLFWDVDKTNLDFEKHQRYIVQRVLEYGLMKDWKLIKQIYGIKLISKISTELRDLEPRCLSFISTISNIPINKFRCYTTKQLNPPHWNF